MTFENTPAENIVTLFKNANGNCNVALRQGPVVSFIDGRFFTTDKRLQSYLQEAADEGEYGVFVDRNEPSIDTEAATPMEQLRKKIRAELLLEMQQTPLGESSSYAPQTGQAQRAIGGTDLVIGAAIQTPEVEQKKDESVLTEERKEPEKELTALEKLNLLKSGNSAQ